MKETTFYLGCTAVCRFTHSDDVVPRCPHSHDSTVTREVTRPMENPLLTALGEVKEAVDALAYAAQRLNTAAARLQAVGAIEAARQN